MNAQSWFLASLLGPLVCLAAVRPAAAQWLAPPPWDASVRLDNRYTMRDSKPVSVGEIAAMMVMGYPLEALVSFGLGLAALVAEDRLSLDRGPFSSHHRHLSSLVRLQLK